MEQVWCGVGCRFAALAQQNTAGRAIPAPPDPQRSLCILRLSTTPLTPVGLNCLLLLYNRHVVHPSPLGEMPASIPVYFIFWAWAFIPPFWVSVIHQAFLGALRLVCQSLHD